MDAPRPGGGRPFASLEIPTPMASLLDVDRSKAGMNGMAEALVIPPTSPTLHQLHHGQNLFVPPPNWLQARLPDGTVVGKSVYHSLPDTYANNKELWSLSLASHVAPGEEVDVIAPAERLKDLFLLPYTTSPVSLSVHRLGSTLILDDGPGSGTASGHTPLPADRDLYAKFLYRSALPPPPPGAREAGDVKVLEAKARKHERVMAKSSEVAAASSGPIPGPALYFDEAGTAHPQPSPVPCGPVMPNTPLTPQARSPFRRVCSWKFNGYNMLLGSDLLAFTSADGRPVSLRLQDIEAKLTQGESLHMYLDNTMAGIPESAICYHKDGVVQSYNIVATEDIPALSAEPFSPFILEQNAVTLLKFLQENCHENYGSYWLYRNGGESVMQLFDLSQLPSSSAGETKRKWNYIMAMLCYRYATQLGRASGDEGGRLQAGGRPRKHSVTSGDTQPRRHSVTSGEPLAQPQTRRGAPGHRKMLLEKCAELLLGLEDEREEEVEGEGDAGTTASRSAVQAFVYEDLAELTVREALGKGQDEPAAEEDGLAVFNRAVKYLLLSMEHMRRVIDHHTAAANAPPPPPPCPSPPSSSEFCDGLEAQMRQGEEGEEGFVDSILADAVEKMNQLREKIVTVGLECSARLAVSGMCRLSLVVLDDTLRCWLESRVETTAPLADSPWSCLTPAVTAKVLEVCGDALSVAAEQSSMPGAPPATAPYPSLFHFLRSVGAAPLPRLLFVEEAVPIAAPAGAWKNWVSTVLAIRGVPQDALVDAHQMAVCLSAANTMSLSFPDADAGSVDWHTLAVYSHWHALAHMQACGRPKSDPETLRVYRRLGFNLNVMGRRKQAAGEHFLALQLFAWALWTFVEAADTQNQVLVLCNFANALRVAGVLASGGTHVLPATAEILVSTPTSLQATTRACFPALPLAPTALLENAVLFSEAAMELAGAQPRASGSLVPVTCSCLAATRLALAVTLGNMYQGFVEQRDPSTPLAGDVFDDFCKRLSILFHSCLKLYASLEDADQQTAVLYHLGTVHATHACVVACDAARADVVALTADEHLDKAAAGFLPPPGVPLAPKAFERVLMTRRKQAAMHVGLMQRPGADAAFVGDHGTRAVRALVCGVPLGLVRQDWDAAGLEGVGAEARACVPLLRKALLCCVRHADATPYTPKQLRDAYAAALGVDVATATPLALLSSLQAAASALGHAPA